MKKSMLLVFFISFVFTFQSFCYADTIQYKDVKSSDWFYKNTIELSKRGIIEGYTDNSFKPYQLLQRDQLIKLLVASQGATLTNSQGYWATSYIQYAINNKINILDYPNEITPDFYAKAVNRYETTQLALNLIPVAQIPTNYSDFSNQILDFENIPQKYKDIVLKGYALGIITGYPDGYFYGDKTLNRAEASTIVSRVISPSQRFVPSTIEEKAILEAFADKSSILFKDVIAFSNLFSDFVIENDDFIYKNIIADYSLSSLDLTPFQTSFCKNILVRWSKQAIINQKSGYVEANINATSFSMATADNQAQLLNSANVNIFVSDNGLISLYLPRSSSPTAPNNISYIKDITDLLLPGSSEALIAEINNHYNIAKQNSLYNTTITFTPYNINIMSEESKIAFTFSFIEK